MPRPHTTRFTPPGLVERPGRGEVKTDSDGKEWMSVLDPYVPHGPGIWVPTGNASPMPRVVAKPPVAPSYMDNSVASPQKIDYPEVRGIEDDNLLALAEQFVIFLVDEPWSSAATIAKALVKIVEREGWVPEYDKDREIARLTRERDQLKTEVDKLQKPAAAPTPPITFGN